MEKNRRISKKQESQSNSSSILLCCAIFLVCIVALYIINTSGKKTLLQINNIADNAEKKSIPLPQRPERLVSSIYGTIAHATINTLATNTSETPNSTLQNQSDTQKVSNDIIQDNTSNENIYNIYKENVDKTQENENKENIEKPQESENKDKIDRPWKNKENENKENVEKPQESENKDKIDRPWKNKENENKENIEKPQENENKDKIDRPWKNKENENKENVEKPQENENKDKIDRPWKSKSNDSKKEITEYKKINKENKEQTTKEDKEKEQKTKENKEKGQKTKEDKGKEQKDKEKEAKEKDKKTKDKEEPKKDSKGKKEDKGKPLEEHLAMLYIKTTPGNWIKEPVKEKDVFLSLLEKSTQFRIGINLYDTNYIRRLALENSDVVSVDNPTQMFEKLFKPQIEKSFTKLKFRDSRAKYPGIGNVRKREGTGVPKDKKLGMEQYALLVQMKFKTQFYYCVFTMPYSQYKRTPYVIESILRQMYFKEK